MRALRVALEPNFLSGTNYNIMGIVRLKIWRTSEYDEDLSL
jgi:hypothetical protein